VSGPVFETATLTIVPGRAGHGYALTSARHVFLTLSSVISKAGSPKLHVTGYRQCLDEWIDDFGFNLSSLQSLLLFQDPE